MTSIDKLKKINEMTKILKQHGIATSSDDALKKSSEIYEYDIQSSNSDNSSSNTSSDNEKSESNVNMEPLLREMENKHRRLSERMAQIESNVSNVIGKMNEMIQVIKRLDGPTKNQSQNPQQTFKEEVKSTPEASPETSPEKPKPRTGDFKPGNVDIMDFFNYSK